VASPLENLNGPGKPLRQEPPDEKEFSGLRRSALSRARDVGCFEVLGRTPEFFRLYLNRNWRMQARVRRSQDDVFLEWLKRPT
jgi:hypothetical protein